MTNLVPYKFQYRYGGLREDDERWAKVFAAMKVRRPEMYERHRKQEAINAIRELSPEWQEEQQRLEEEVRQESGYALLGLDPNIDVCKRQVKNAYRRQARKLHPDIGGDADQFKTMYAAYRMILAATPT